MSGAWGSGGWGSGSYGGGSGLSSIAFVDAQAFRENVIRVQFDNAVSITGLLEQSDASRPEKWSAAAVSGTFALTGDPARSVTIIGVTAPGVEDGIDASAVGRFVDLTLDRPLSPFPAMYDVSWVDVFDSTLADSTSGTFRIAGVYRLLEQPQVEVARPARDFANPQTLGAVPGALLLGTFNVGSDGDYANDEGNASLKKRVIRRLVTKKNAFAHLPGYGVGIPDEAKRLGLASVLSGLASDAQVQLAQEPDVSQVRVTPTLDRNNPGLVFFRVVIRPRVGPTLQFDVPFQRSA